MKKYAEVAATAFAVVSCSTMAAVLLVVSAWGLNIAMSKILLYISHLARMATE